MFLLLKNSWGTHSLEMSLTSSSKFLTAINNQVATLGGTKLEGSFLCAFPSSQHMDISVLCPLPFLQALFCINSNLSYFSWKHGLLNMRLWVQQLCLTFSVFNQNVVWSYSRLVFYVTLALHDSFYDYYTLIFFKKGIHCKWKKKLKVLIQHAPACNLDQSVLYVYWGFLLVLSARSSSSCQSILQCFPILTTVVRIALSEHFVLIPSRKAHTYTKWIHNPLVGIFFPLCLSNCNFCCVWVVM